MARMYSGRKGKSGSHKPAQKKAPWVKYKPREVEEIVGKLAKQGSGSAEIGLVLRDQYGIPSVRAITKKKMQHIMKDQGATQELPEDLYSLLKLTVKLKTHLERNKHDRYSKRGLELAESKIRRLAKYYKEKKILPEKWQYDPEKAKLLVK